MISCAIPQVLVPVCGLALFEALDENDLFVFQVMLQVNAEQNQPDEDNGDVEFVPEVNEHFHVLTEFDADPGEEIAPDQGADEGGADKHPEMGFEHAGRKRDECPYYRQHSADEEGNVAVLIYPFVCKIEVLFLEQEPFAVLGQKRTTTVQSKKVGRDRTEYTADSACQSGQVNVHFPFVYENPGGRHDCFTGQWDVGRFDSHHDDDAEVAPISYLISYHLQDWVDKLVKHGTSSVTECNDAILQGRLRANIPAA